MAELIFPNVGNALLAGSQAAYFQGRNRKERADEQRRLDAQPNIQAALKGDTDAFGRLAAGDPTTAASVATMLGRMDANQRAKIKDSAEYSARAANAVLQADPADRPVVYQQMYQEGVRSGHDMRSMPPTYSPDLDGRLRGIRLQGMSIKDQMDLQQNEPVRLPPLGAASSGSAAAPSPNRDQFVHTMMPHALAVSQATGLDPRLVIAQSALETGYGASAPGNNYFGIKSHGAAGGQVLPTTEVGQGGAYQTRDSFRTYGDAGASAQDYANFLKTNGRYGPVLAAKGLDAQIDAMGKSGYATDPNYATKLRQIAAGLPMPLHGAPSPGVPGPVANGPPVQLAQGDAGQAGPGGIRVVPEQALAPEALGVRERLRAIRPGWGMIISGKTRQPAYDSQGRLHVYGPNGEEDFVEIPKAPTTDQAQAAKKASVEQANKLRDDFRSEPVVKAYRVVVPMLESARDAATRPTRAADLNLVYAFAKLMDPESVVRESETGMVVASGTVTDRLAGMLGQLNGGQTLQPETRAKLIRELESRFKSLDESYRELSESYGEIADSNGVKRSHVILPIRKPKDASKPEGGDREKLLNDARAAIQKGADPAAVAKRLKEMGVEDGL